MNIIEQVNHLNWDTSEIESDVLTLAYNVQYDTVYESCKAFMATNPSNEQVEQFYVGFVSRFDKRSISEILGEPCCENCGRFTDERQMTYTDDNKFICKLCD